MADHFSASLLRGAEVGNLAQVKESWKKAENRYETNFRGHNALTLSIIHNQFEVFQYLVDEGANLDQVNHVSSLCEKGKYSSLKEHEGDDSCLGETSLICAVIRRNFRMVQYLVEKGASVNIPNREGHIALYYALLKRCDTEMIEYLIREGSNVEMTCEQVDEYAQFHENFISYWNGIRRQLGI